MCAPRPRSVCSTFSARPPPPPTCAASRPLTGSGAAELLRAHERALTETAAILRTSPENVVGVVRARERVLREIEKLTGARAEQIPVQLEARIEMGAQAEGALSVGVDAAALAEALR